MSLGCTGERDHVDELNATWKLAPVQHGDDALRFVLGEVSLNDPFIADDSVDIWSLMAQVAQVAASATWVAE